MKAELEEKPTQHEESNEQEGDENKSISSNNQK